MKISAQDVLAWEVVAQVIQKNEPAEYESLHDIIEYALNDNYHKDMAGAFDVGEAVQYTALTLFVVIKEIIKIVAPDVLHGLSSITIDYLKETLSRSSDKDKPSPVQPSVHYSPAEIRKIVLAICRKKKISGELTESIADAITVRLLTPPQR